MPGGSFLAFSLSGYWDSLSHNWALVSILLTLVLLLVIPALVLLKYVRICLNIISTTEPPLSMTQLNFDRLQGDEKDFYATDGVRLRGVFYHPPPGVTRRGTIIFAPEFKSDRHSCARYCRPLIEAGYDIFSFDFRGHGGSAQEKGYTPRQWASDRESADIMGAIAYIKQWLEEMGHPQEIGLFGISRGGCSSIIISESTPCVKAIVVDGAFSSDCTLEHLMKRWAYIFAKVKMIYENHPPEFWRFLRWCLFVTCRIKFKCVYPSVRKTLMRLPPRPILLIHGERDSYIPVDQSRLLYALASQPKFLWIVRGAKHNQSVDVAGREYAERTVDFFHRYLGHDTSCDNMYNEKKFAEVARRELAGVSRSMNREILGTTVRGAQPVEHDAVMN